jgi:hypothetical protein
MIGPAQGEVDRMSSSSGPGYSPGDEHLVARLRERIGTSTKATRRREIFDQHLNEHKPRNADEFRASFLDLTQKLRISGGIPFAPPGAHIPHLLDPGPPLVHPPVQHVFGPDDYVIAVGQADGVSGVNIGASADPSTSKLRAAEFVTVDAALAWAVLGARLTPASDCLLSVRPYLQWEGFDALQSFDADPNLRQQAWATARGEVGIYIDSAEPDGDIWHEDVNLWNTVWERTEANPQGTRSYEGTENPSTGLGVDNVFAGAGRIYEIEIGIRAFVSVQPTFAVGAGASAEISAVVPFIVVEETLH